MLALLFLIPAPFVNLSARPDQADPALAACKNNREKAGGFHRVNLCPWGEHPMDKSPLTA